MYTSVRLRVPVLPVVKVTSEIFSKQHANKAMS